MAQHAGPDDRPAPAAGDPGPLSRHAAGGRQRSALYKTYLQQFEQALKTHPDSAGVIKAMETQWPGLAESSSLELSAKVNTGEMKW